MLNFHKSYAVITFFRFETLLTFPVLLLRNPPAAQPTTMTSTSYPPKPATRNLSPRRSTPDSLPGKGKRPDPRDVKRRKNIPRTTKKKPKTKSLEPTMVHTSAKAADGKPVAGRSPMEVDQALRDRSLPEAHILAICALMNSPPSPETKN